MSSHSKPPPIGALRRRLRLEALDLAADGAGGLTGTWTQVAEIWGAVQPRTGLETFSGDGIEARVTHDVWIRPRSDVLAGHRLRLLDGRLLNIRAVLTPDVFLNRSRLICEQHSP